MPKNIERLNIYNAAQEAGALTAHLNKEYPEQSGQFTPEQYTIFDLLNGNLDGYAEIDSDNYEILINPQLQTELPPEFIKNPTKYLHENGRTLKQANRDGKYPDEEIIQTKLSEQEIIAKRVETKKVKVAKQELAISLTAQKAGLGGVKSVGFLTAKDRQSGDYLLMEKVQGVSVPQFIKEINAKLGEGEIALFKKIINLKIEEIAENYRQRINIDKTWYLKDFLIDFDWDNKKIINIVPLDWERVRLFNPDKPGEIERL